MFTERSEKQNRLEMVILENLVPQDHLLRKIDHAIDFSFNLWKFKATFQ